MPFESKRQVRKCFAMKGRGRAKGWDCEEWAHKTRSIGKLPEKKAALVAALEKRATTSARLLGVRAAARLLGVPATS